MRWRSWRRPIHSRFPFMHSLPRADLADPVSQSVTLGALIATLDGTTGPPDAPARIRAGNGVRQAWSSRGGKERERGGRYTRNESSDLGR